jgi:hypothetical protein
VLRGLTAAEADERRGNIRIDSNDEERRSRLSGRTFCVLKHMQIDSLIDASVEKVNSQPREMEALAGIRNMRTSQYSQYRSCRREEA